jgi:hypothetical protein
LLLRKKGNRNCHCQKTGKHHFQHTERFLSINGSGRVVINHRLSKGLDGIFPITLICVYNFSGC